MQPAETKDPQGPHRFQKRGFSFEKAIRYFFASNAGLTIVILLLILVFLLKEGLGFFPGYQRELSVYRIAGLEFVDLSRKNLTAHEQLTSLLNRAYFAEINGKSAKQLRRSQEASALFNSYTDQTGPTRDLVLSNTQEGSTADSEILTSLRANFQKQKEKALKSLPDTPHLNDTERQGLIDSILHRAVDSTEDPPLVAALAEEYAAAQQKHAEPLLDLRTTIDNFESAGSELGSLVSQMTETVTVTKEKIQTADILEKDRKTLLAAAANAKDAADRERLTADALAALADKPDIEGPMQILMESKPACIDVHLKLKESTAGIVNQLPANLTQPEAIRLLNAARAVWPVFLSDLEKTPAAITGWNHLVPVPLTAAISSFLTGKHWVTGGEWQDFYGILPLAVGSLMIAIVALCIAIPTGIGAAIYVNQFASNR